MAATTLTGQDDATRRVLDQMRAVRVEFPGLQPTMADLFTGYSVTMGLMVVTVGALLLAVTRADDRVDPARAGLAAVAASSAIGLVVAWLLLPLPPVLGLGVALVAAVTGLVRTTRWRLPPRPSQAVWSGSCPGPPSSLSTVPAGTDPPS